MEKQQIEAELKSYFETEFPNPGLKLESSTDLLSNFITDSLRVVATVAFMENHFGIDITESDIGVETFRDLNNLSDFVFSKL